MDNEGFIHGGEGQGDSSQPRREASGDFTLSDGQGREDRERFQWASETEESGTEKHGPRRGSRDFDRDEGAEPSSLSDSGGITMMSRGQDDDFTEPIPSPSSDAPTLTAKSPSRPAVADEELIPVPSLKEVSRSDSMETSSYTKKKRRIPRRNLASHNHDTSANYATTRSIIEALQVGELIVLQYGVLVMFNFSAAEEQQIIEDVISSGCVRGTLRSDDIESEAFHFCYDPTIPAPRIFNDFFTFRTSNHLLKLSLAHAIAQSTKLSVFEESMQRTLELTSHIPRDLASTGVLNLKRREALRLTGRLFKLRVDVNLTSNVLDTPELFWSEASLEALYVAIREYLEIDQRVENLNERLAVANDLLDIIHEHISNEAMSKM